MNLGTGKITKKEMKKVPHHLLDVASPKKTFSVSNFKKLADKKIKQILKRGAVPIICGGTGFYIDAVVDGIVLPEVPPNKKLRVILSKKNTDELYLQLKKLDPIRAETIDRKNPVRLIRAIEIAQALGSVPTPSHRQGLWLGVLKIGLALPDEVLKEKIKVRLLARIKKGMIKEIENLHKEGISWKRMEALGLEYKYGALCLQNKITKQEMIEKLVTETWQYAKRQKTWFKRDKNTLWIDPRHLHEKAKAIRKIDQFLKQ